MFEKKIPHIPAFCSTASDAIKTLREDLDFFDDWVEKYQYIIDIGQKLENFPKEFQNENFRVRGCQSQVWLVGDFDEGKIYFLGASDSSIVSGLVTLLLKIYSGRTPKEILLINPVFIKEIGLLEALSTQRGNGVLSIINVIQGLAKKYRKD